MGKPKAKVEKDNAERWLLTYADLMNLLLIFFIVLYAMSQVDTQKFQQLSESLREALGSGAGESIIAEGGSGNSVLELPSTQNPPATPSPSDKKEGDKNGTGAAEEKIMQDVKAKLEKLIDKRGLINDVTVSVEERGVIVSINAKLLFKRGSAELEHESQDIIREIAEILMELDVNQVRIEGHTDSDPMNTFQFPSNWELSSARATNVLRFILSNVAINPTKISAVGYGQYRPKVPNTTLENKAINRRVNIVIVRSTYNMSEPTAVNN